MRRWSVLRIKPFQGRRFVLVANVLPHAGMLYVVDTPMPAIIPYNDDRGSIAVLEQGSLVECTDCADGEGLVVAVWNGREILVFASDIRDRASLFPNT